MPNPHDRDVRPRPRPPAAAAVKARIDRLGGARSLASGASAPGAFSDSSPGLSSGPSPGFGGVISLGVGAIDEVLPWGGLLRAGLHEVIATGGSMAAAIGFCAAWLARLLEGGGSILWCRRDRDLYGPGLAAFGLDLERVVVAHGRKDSELFWAMEEALRSGALVGVLGEINTAAGSAVWPTALRRLQLAAEARGTMALLLRSPSQVVRSTPAVTRWRVGTAPATPAEGTSFSTLPMRESTRAEPVRPCWQVELIRCKSGGGGLSLPTAESAAPSSSALRPTGALRRWPAHWLMECDETGRLRLAAELRHRPADGFAATGAADTRIHA